MKVGRKLGGKNTKKYSITPAVIAQRQNAAVKSLESRRTQDEAQALGKTDMRGHLKKKITDGYQHLRILKEVTACETCTIRNHCNMYEELKNETGKARTKCPMFSIYRNAVIDVTQNPLMYLARKAAALDTAIHQQMVLDSQDGIPISKEMLAATKLAMEAVKISQKAEKRAQGKRKVIGENPDDDIIEADFEVKEV